MPIGPLSQFEPRKNIKLFAFFWFLNRVCASCAAVRPARRSGRHAQRSVQNRARTGKASCEGHLPARMASLFTPPALTGARSAMRNNEPNVSLRSGIALLQRRAFVGSRRAARPARRRRAQRHAQHVGALLEQALVLPQRREPRECARLVRGRDRPRRARHAKGPRRGGLPRTTTRHRVRHIRDFFPISPQPPRARVSPLLSPSPRVRTRARSRAPPAKARVVFHLLKLT